MPCVHANPHENEASQKRFSNSVEEFENVSFAFSSVDGEHFEKKLFDNYDKSKTTGGCFFKFLRCNMDGAAFPVRAFDGDYSLQLRL